MSSPNESTVADVATHAKSDLERRSLAALLELSHALTDTSDIEGTLHHIARQVAEVMEAERCSIVVFDVDDATGFVVATSDDPAMRRKKIALSDYPEFLETIKKREPLIVRDVERDPLFESVRERIKKMPVRTAALFPICLNRRVVGVIHFRSDTVRPYGFLEQQLQFGTIVANTAAIAIRNARLYESIRARAERVFSARFRAERRIRQLEKYQLFFDLAGDGVMIVDAEARILFANVEAREILGFRDADLTRMSLHDLVDENARSTLTALLHASPQARVREDLTVVRANGEHVVLSLSWARVEPQQDGHVHADPTESFIAIVSFRDVTLARRTQIELRETKEFLERLIESTPDAIVAADMTGKILVFNSSAERVTGYTKEAAMQTLNARDLYPRGTARRILSHLRGALNGSRFFQSGHEELLRHDGSTVPISLNAALLVDGATEIGTVGVFCDLRERLRLERELSAAQERLQTSERQAAVLELAGAAAHELSQPLTTIMGSAELLERQLSGWEVNEPVSRHVRRIVSECERMAAVVKSIGHMTRYETKPYMGTTQILDIDASSDLKETK